MCSRYKTRENVQTVPCARERAAYVSTGKQATCPSFGKICVIPDLTGAMRGKIDCKGNFDWICKAVVLNNTCLDPSLHSVEFQDEIPLSHQWPRPVKWRNERKSENKLSDTRMYL